MSEKSLVIISDDYTGATHIFADHIFEQEPIKSQILDARGIPIPKMRNKIGFDLRKRDK